MSGLHGADYWPYVWASYALTLTSLGLLAVLTFARLRHWAARAKAAAAETADQEGGHV
jgi:heme exporter protein D